MCKKIWIITLFPEYFFPLKDSGVVGSALRGERGKKFELNLVQIRDYCNSNYKSVDDSPYGGGAGMVMRADVLKNALVEGVQKKGNYKNIKEELHCIYTSPRGKLWNNEEAKNLAHNYFSDSSKKDIVFICGRYEGIDERFLEKYVNEWISVGDYILSGGELAVATIIDSSFRFIPGVLGNKTSSQVESFQNFLLEEPVYTKPSVFEDLKVPDVLLSGHHKNIEKFRKEEKIKITQKRRPDLYEKYESLSLSRTGSLSDKK